jgi:hypothetical protein
MNRLWRHSRLIGPCLLAVALVGADPVPAAAAWFGVRNDSQMPVIFQGASVVNNVVRRGKAHILAPGQETWELIAPGTKIITIYDGRVPGRVLFEGNIVAGPTDMFFSIRVGLVQVAPGVVVPQATLLPATPKTRPPQR